MQKGRSGLDFNAGSQYSSIFQVEIVSFNVSCHQGQKQADLRRKTQDVFSNSASRGLCTFAQFSKTILRKFPAVCCDYINSTTARNVLGSLPCFLAAIQIFICHTPSVPADKV